MHRHAQTPLHSRHMTTFLRNSLHWAIGLAAVLAVGPLAARLLFGITDARGDHLASILTSNQTGRALAGLALVLLGSLIVGRIARAIGGASLALMCAGLVLGWGAFAFGSVEEAIRGTHASSFFPLLAVEGLVLCILAALLAMHLAVPTMRLPLEIEKIESESSEAKLTLLAQLIRVRKTSGIATLVQCIIVSAIVAAAVTALCSTSMLRGQTIFAAFVGAVLAGVAAQVTAAAGSARISPAVPALGVALAALVAPFIAMSMHGSSLVPDTLAGNLAWIGRPLPIDWAAGGLLGVHVGMGWAGATLAQAANSPASTNAPTTHAQSSTA
jgi:hypothetical protein